jgi:hypothetical protein
VADRALFIIRKVTKGPNDVSDKVVDVDGFCKYTLLVKGCMHLLLIVLVHYYFFIEIPRSTNRRFQESGYLIVGYLLTCIYFMCSCA